MATIATAFVALAALAVASCQLLETNKSQQELIAQEAYKEYMKVAIANPDIADGLFILPMSEQGRARYGWFVSYFLHSAEQIHALFPKDKSWNAGLANQVCLHATFLQDEEFQTNLKFHYECSFRQFVARALENCR